MPAARLVAEALTEDELHAYVYGLVPPLATEEALPLLTPLQLAAVVEPTVTLSAGGADIVTLAEPRQPLESVIVTV